MQKDLEQKLIDKARQGQTHAFNALAANCYIKLLHSAYPLTKNADDAKDIVQDALIKAFRKITQFNGESTFYSWAYRIMRNTALDHLAKAKRAPALTDIDAQEAHEQLHDHASPEAYLEQQQTGVAITKAYGKLPKELRVILKLRDLGHPYETIARKVKRPIGTIRSRLSRARNLLTRFLTPSST